MLFPLLTFGIYVALSRIFARSQGPPGPLPPLLKRVEAVPPVSGRRAPLVAAGRSLLVGGVLGLEVAIIVDTERPTPLLLLTSVAYAVAVLLVSVGVAQLSSRTIAEVASLVNTLVAPLTIALLYGVSESTQVTVAASGAVYQYPGCRPGWRAR